MAMSARSKVFLINGSRTECNAPTNYKCSQSFNVNRESILRTASSEASSNETDATPASGSVTFPDRHELGHAAGLDTDVIDGRSFLGDSMEAPFPGHQSTSRALRICNKTIVGPYLVSLKLIGWRKFSSAMDLHESKIRKNLNILYPSVIFLVILLTLATRTVICFDRTQVDVDRINGSFSYIECNHTFEYSVFSVIIAVSYLLGLYVFRITYPEYLVTLIEKVFLDFSDKHGKFSQKRLLLHMRSLFSVGVIWMIFSIIVNILRVKSLRLLEKNTYFERFTSYNTSEDGMRQLNYELRVALVLITVSGFTMVDFLYIAIVMNYALQCQVIFFAVSATVNRFKTRFYLVDAAIKEIRQLQDFLAVLNGKLASLMSLELFVFVGSCVQTFINIGEIERHQTTAIIIGVCEFLTSFTLLFFVVMQAVRVTAACAQIKHLGLELRTRPFAYTRMQQVELDSFLLYTCSITVDARLIHIPMKPMLVAPVLFAVAVVWRVFLTDSIKWI